MRLFNINEEAFSKGRIKLKKITLGQEYNFDNLVAALTQDKFNEWAVEIKKRLEDSKTTAKQLDTIVSRSSHTYQIFQLNLYFQNCLRKRINQSSNKNWKIKLTNQELEDLRLQ